KKQYETIYPPPKKKKRSREQVDSESDTDGSIECWPRFLMIESTDSSRPLSKLSPFALQRGIQGLAGIVRNVTRLRSGQVLIEVDKQISLRQSTPVKNDSSCANESLLS
ncbi:hypothetical protein LSH36_386g02046, partial [Paralvinella palmiformis]